MPSSRGTKEDDPHMLVLLPIIITKSHPTEYSRTGLSVLLQNADQSPVIFMTEKSWLKLL